MCLTFDTGFYKNNEDDFIRRVGRQSGRTVSYGHFFTRLLRVTFPVAQQRGKAGRVGTSGSCSDTLLASWNDIGFH